MADDELYFDVDRDIGIMHENFPEKKTLDDLVELGVFTITPSNYQRFKERMVHGAKLNNITMKEAREKGFIK